MQNSRKRRLRLLAYFPHIYEQEWKLHRILSGHFSGQTNEQEQIGAPYPVRNIF